MNDRIEDLEKQVHELMELTQDLFLLFERAVEATQAVDLRVSGLQKAMQDFLIRKT